MGRSVRTEGGSATGEPAGGRRVAALARGAEESRLAEDSRREKNWKRWGPYLSERQWGTVREDYSADGDCWNYLPHDHARSRAYRWGEDGLLGISDREGRLCFALALWNGKDPILKERLFGLGGPEGNHGEDVKEAYWYLDSTPTHSWMKAQYKYPQREFPYQRLVEENRARGRHERELELEECGAFDEGRYFDVVAEYAKAAPEDLCVRITVTNRGPEAARLHLLPTLWFRNTWSWGCRHEGCTVKPSLRDKSGGGATKLVATHPTLGTLELYAAPNPDGKAAELLFTDNETNMERLFGAKSLQPFVKDAFHRRVVGGELGAVNPGRVGTKAAPWYVLDLAPGASRVVKLRLLPAATKLPASGPFGAEFDRTFALRLAEADDFYAARTPARATAAERAIARQAYAGLLWSKQFYHYVVEHWLEGDPEQPTPPASRRTGRNHEWPHLFNRDVISMPDKWEYPWYAAWDLAFHMLPFARLDPEFAKSQLVLFLREWYMHPNGQIPAYEFNFSDVNPPVFAWAAWRVFKMTAPRGHRDRVFLARIFAKLMINFTWWVNRKDEDDDNLFSGGFLGLDNIGVFDRSRPLPTGGRLAQADGTAWMGFYAAHMLSIAFELADIVAVEDLASKFFEHFIGIADAINRFGGTGLWDEQDGFYYDQIEIGGKTMPLRVRSMVGLIPLFTAEVLEESVLERFPAFKKRMEWLLENREDLAKNITYMQTPSNETGGHRLLAIPTRERLIRALAYVLDEDEFLSPYGIRSLSLVHDDKPYVINVGGEEYRVDYAPGDADTGMFGGNSNWRGPIWLPLNYLLIEALERYDFFYGDSLVIECPTGSGNLMRLRDVAKEIARRLTRIFLPDEHGVVPAWGAHGDFMASDPHFKELVPFHEFFHAEKGWGCGAEHQTGWTALIINLIRKLHSGEPRGNPNSMR